METLISIFREVRDPRDFNAQHDLAAMLFISLAATLCGAKSCVDIADFAAANEATLAEIVDLDHGAPSHDSFSRVFRLLDPDEMAQAFARFVAAMREGLGLDPASGVVAIDGKRLRRGYERGRACMPPLMVSVWDAEQTDSGHDRHEWQRASVIARPADAPDFPGLSAIGRYETEREADGKVVKAVHYVALSKRLSPQRLLEVTRRYWSVENQCHWRLDVAFYEDDARTRKNYGPQNLAVLRRIALDILSAHPDKRSVGRKMKLAAWSKDFFFDLFAHLR